MSVSIGELLCMCQAKDVEFEHRVSQEKYKFGLYAEIIQNDEELYVGDDESDAGISPMSCEKLKPLVEEPKHLEYASLGDKSKLPMIITSNLEPNLKERLLEVLKKHKTEIAWKISNICGINPSFCTHKILMENEVKPKIQPQRRLKPNRKEVVKVEVKKLMEVGLIYPISDSAWVSLVQVVPKKEGMIVVPNDRNELILTYTVTG